MLAFGYWIHFANSKPGFAGAFDAKLTLDSHVHPATFFLRSVCQFRNL